MWPVFKKLSLQTQISSICLFLSLCLSLFTIIYFSVQVHNDIISNNQYIGYNSNITSYDIVKSGNQYHGFIDIQSLYSSNNCSLFIYSDQTKDKVNAYLTLYYHLYTDQYFYYKNNANCFLTLTTNLSNNVGLVVGFCIITFLVMLLIVFALIPIIKDQLKNIKMDNQIVEMMTVKTSI